MVFEDLALIHGHSWPAEEIMTCKYLIAGHQHPLISITDAFGKKHTEPVWLIAKCEKKTLAKYYKKFNKNIRLILMPAFNPLVGSPINIDEKKQFGVIFNNKLFKVDDAIVFRLDGTCLGELKNINLRNPRRPYGKTKTRT